VRTLLTSHPVHTIGTDTLIGGWPWTLHTTAEDRRSRLTPRGGRLGIGTTTFMPGNLLGHRHHSLGTQRVGGIRGHFDVSYQRGTRGQCQPTPNSNCSTTKNVRSFSHTASLTHLADSPCHCSPVAGAGNNSSPLQRAPNVTR